MRMHFQDSERKRNDTEKKIMSTKVVIHFLVNENMITETKTPMRNGGDRAKRMGERDELSRSSECAVKWK